MSSETRVKGNGTNWQAAKAYYLALDSTNRSFAAVSRRFKVSPTRVGVIARSHGWVEEAKVVDARTERRAITQIVRNRADRLARTLELYDRANDLALQMLPLDEAGRIDVGKLGTMPRVDQVLEKIPGLFKMAQLAAGEATDRVSIADVQPVLVAFARIAVLAAPAEERGQVMAELEAASSGLVTLEAAA